MVCKYRHLHRRTAVLPPEIIIIIPPRRIHRHTHCLIRFSCFGSFSITPPQCAHSRTPLKATEQLRWNVMWCFCFSTDEFFFLVFLFLLSSVFMLCLWLLHIRSCIGHVSADLQRFKWHFFDVFFCRAQFTVFHIHFFDWIFIYDFFLFRYGTVSLWRW